MGNRMTWEDIVKKYPDKWVVLKDPVLDGSDIVTGIVVDVKSDDEILSYRLENFDKKYDYCRTTEGFYRGATMSVLDNINTDEYIGRQMSFDDMKMLFPDKWVVYNEIPDNKQNKDCILLFVTEKRKTMWDFIFSYVETTGKEPEHYYTTEFMDFNGLQ